MKKLFLIGKIVFMFAFVVGVNSFTETDIGPVIECEALDVDQMATVDNAFTSVEYQNQILLSEAEVEISYGISSGYTAKGIAFAAKKMTECQPTSKELTIACVRLGKILNGDLAPDEGRKTDLYGFNPLYNATSDNSGLMPLLSYRQKDSDFKNGHNYNYRFLKLDGTVNEQSCQNQKI